MNLRLVMAGVLALVLGMVSCAKQNIASDGMITYPDLEKLVLQKPSAVNLVDVRALEEYADGHIPGAVNIPVDIIADKPPTADLNARIVVYCRSGARSARAKAALVGKGYVNVSDFGSVVNWKGELVKGDKPE
jgi:phage shock protein E